MSTPKKPRQMTPEELERFMQEPRIKPTDPNQIRWKTSTGLEGTITLDQNAELKALADKISGALRSYELNTGTAPVVFEMMLFLREIS